MNFTQEQLTKAKAAKSAEELLALAKENGLELTEEEAKNYFEQWHKKGELADEELDNVSGGCGGPDGPKYNAGQRVHYWYPNGVECYGTIISSSYSNFQKAWYYVISMDNGDKMEEPLESEYSAFDVIS